MAHIHVSQGLCLQQCCMSKCNLMWFMSLDRLPRLFAEPSERLEGVGCARTRVHVLGSLQEVPALQAWQTGAFVGL